MLKSGKNSGIIDICGSTFYWDNWHLTNQTVLLLCQVTVIFTRDLVLTLRNSYVTEYEAKKRWGFVFGSFGPLFPASEAVFDNMNFCHRY